jgi:hypothetical protein
MRVSFISPSSTAYEVEGIDISDFENADLAAATEKYLLATGGTAKAAATLVEKLGGEVAMLLFVIELFDLHGRDVLKGYNVESLTKFPGH